MKNIKYILLIVFSFILCGCNKVIVDKLPEGYFLNIKSDTIEVHSDIKLIDLIENTNIIADNKSDLINTHLLGENTHKWYFEIDGKIYLQHIKYNVIDTTSPKIFGESNKTFYVGNEQNICNLVMYGDNYDKNPKCIIKGSYDFNEVGKYKIKIVITDSSNNSSNFNMTLNIIDKQNNNKNNNKKTEISKVQFTDVYETYKTDSTKIGIDVSRWQGDIDYNKVKSEGAEFVIMRIGVQQDFNEDPAMDSKYLQNIKNAKTAGLDVGVYFYSMAKTKKEAKKQAKWVIKNLDNEKLELPIVFDWESWNEWNSLNLSFYDINSIADTFMSTVKDAGYESMLYGSKFYLESIWENKNEYPVWLAHYTNNALTDYKEDFKIWQMCSDGNIDGIDGDVDINVMFLK